MPSKIVEELIREMAEVKTEIRWLKWIICGAAGLGFLEKVFGWMK